MPYDHQSIEKKWQKFWEENKTFSTENPVSWTPFVKGDKGDLVSEKNPQSLRDSSFTKELQKPKKYILDMFPYPSGAGLHVGHPKWYTATDIVSRFYHAKWYNILHPMGFDAFGLPAENYAIKTGTHPRVTTAENIETFIGQLKNLGFSYDWNRMVDTTDPEYYKWTQWIFLELFKRGLAYEQDLPINYCPSCKTGLANEEVLSDNTCDRCGTRVERRPIRQWVLRITEYAERLISDLDGLDWPEGIKEMQRNWIGKSEGCEFRMMKKVDRKPTALILHGWDDEENRTEWHWMAPLKEDLEKSGYRVIMEQLPWNNTPDLEKQLEFLEQYREMMDEKSIVIGHSMGWFLGMHFVERLWKKIDKLVCVAPIFNWLIDHVDWSTSATGWEIGSNSMKKNYNPEIIQKNVNTWQVFLSENDSSILYHLSKKHFEEIQWVSITSIANGWHFCKWDGYTRFDAILEYIIPHIRVYTTRVDTVFGMTYAVLAPDHPKVEDFITPEQRDICEKYITDAKSKSDQDRTADNKEKTGVWTGSFVVNPYNGESFPLWIADYVLGHYGTGAVMAVPAHDERDFEFAKKYNLSIKQSIAPKFTFSWEIEPRKEKDTIVRNCVDALMENQDWEILLLKESRWIHLPWGGLDGEDEITALRREILEETGYTDIDIWKRITTSFYHAYKKGLDKNATGTCVFYSVKVLSENRVMSEVEQGLHEMSWETKGNVSKFLNWDNHDFWWNQFINPTSFCDDGFLVNSSEFDWLPSAEARRVLTEKAESEGFGVKKVNYKLRDWLFSRQRYWGEPIPLIHISEENYTKLPLLTEKDGIPYFTLWGKSTPKTNENIKYFDPVNAIVKHWSDDSYVVLTFKNGERWLIWGSVEPGETREEAIIREVQEETGYKNVRIEKLIISKIYSRGYKERKNLEEEACESIYLVQILDDEKIESSIEEGIISSDWIRDDDVVNSITLDHHKFYWNYYRGLTAYRIKRESWEFLYINNTEFSQIYDGINGKIIIDSRLPLTLPEVERYEPAGDGQSPLATVPSFVNVKLAENLSGKRETNTMPQWGGSCWYYLRYMDSKNPDVLASKEALDYWGSVDEYVGGAEHAVLHLLYARFWHKVLYDAGIVPTKEPFQKLTNVGMILAYAYERADGGLVAVDLVEERDGKFWEKATGKEVKQIVAKMSKSLKNVVNPNDIVREYGADTLRLYEMNMAGFMDTAPWNPEAITGVRRFLDKAYSAFMAEVKSEKWKVKSSEMDSTDMKKMKLLHKTIKKVGEDIVGYKFNTAISSLMILLNEGIPTDAEFASEWKEAFAILLHPFAPHMAEELWHLINSRHSDEGRIQEISDTLDASQAQHDGSTVSIYNAPWPEYDDFMLVDDEVTIAIQVNGKLRGTLNCFNWVAQDEVSALAHADPDIEKWITGKVLVREIFVPNKLLSIVVKD
jgi:leucyl-tRNA synthetase